MKPRTKLALKCEAVMITIALIMLLIFLGSCTTTKVVTVEKVKTDTTYITQHQRDSIWLHDSIHVSEKGDTIRIEKWHTKYIEREVHDTLYRAKTDSIPVPYEVIKEVPRQKTWLERAVVCAGIIAIMILTLIMIRILIVVSKLKKFLP